VDWDPQVLYEQALSALNAGESPRRVDAQIEKVTGGQVKSFDDLSKSVGGDWARSPAAAQQRLSATGARGENAFTDANRMMDQGASMDWMDEVRGDRQRVEDLRTLSPMASFLSEIGGGMTLPVAGASGAAGAAPSMGRAVGMAGLFSGAQGALSGAGNAEGGLLERAKGAVVPGLISAVAGMLPPTVVGGFRGMRNRARNLPFGSAEGTLTRTLRESGVSGEDLPGQVARLGPDAVVADLSPGLMSTARKGRDLASSPELEAGPIQALRDRTANRGGRLARALRVAAGFRAPNYRAHLTKLLQQKAAVGDEFYRPLEAITDIDHPEVWTALRSPIVREAFEAQRTSMVRVSPGRAGVLPDLDARQPLNFIELDRTRKILRDAQNKYAKAGDMVEAGDVGAVLKEFTDALDHAVDGFGEARKQAQVAIRSVDAYKLGRKLASADAEVILAALAAEPVAEARDALRYGIASKWQAQLTRQGSGGGMAQTMMKAGDETRARIAAVTANDAGFQQVMRQAQREARYMQTSDIVVGGSATSTNIGGTGPTSLPLTKQGIFMEIMATLFRVSPEERLQAGKVIAEALTTNGEEAARTLAAEIAHLSAISGRTAAVGAATGTAAGKAADALIRR
jgi:hypothetical protein